MKICDDEHNPVCYDDEKYLCPVCEKEEEAEGIRSIDALTREQQIATLKNQISHLQSSNVNLQEEISRLNIDIRQLRWDRDHRR